MCAKDTLFHWGVHPDLFNKFDPVFGLPRPAGAGSMMNHTAVAFKCWTASPSRG